MKKLQNEKAEMQIGKKGFTKEVLAELMKRIYRKKQVKIKVLKTLEGSRKELGQDIAKRLGLVFIQAKGNTVIFSKKELPEKGKRFKNPKLKQFLEQQKKSKKTKKRQ